ncbi:MotA/TolQ/ExbB proton channel family protein [uncultured Methanosphaera sp.]|uniref:MotA/TolQ/ExbB proton channel family protein n=1 Tax=uncultured Methanosphaera sp. TaxID=262501 RepID=UPI000DC44332|nr:MotA/TolQ/ExbB proton channel family protein [uncultured Methanosphaera sp.]RAP44042.1 MAG: flagellar motor protein MotA [Methanosphaera sp. SHI1033]
MSTIPGSGILSAILDVIAQSLLLPVMILLVIFVIIVLIEIGGIIAERVSRTTLSEKELDYLINNIAESETSEEIINYINSCKLQNKYKEILVHIVKTSNLKENTREAYVRELIENEEFKISKTLRRTDIVTRVSSGCGLLGTLIPLGPGLAALGTGDVATLSSQLAIAFNTTTVGLTASLLSYTISKIRRGWYEEDISVIYTITEAIVEVDYD